MLLIFLLDNGKADKENEGAERPAKRKKGKKGKGRPPKKQKLILKEKKNIRKDVPVAHVEDFDNFAKEIRVQRKLPNMETLLFKCGVDEGQHLLKICLSVIHLLAEKDPSKKKFEAPFKDSGVKKVFVIAVTAAKETKI